MAGWVAGEGGKGGVVRHLSLHDNCSAAYVNPWLIAMQPITRSCYLRGVHNRLVFRDFRLGGGHVPLSLE